MPRRVEAAVRRDEHMVAEAHGRGIEDDRVMIGEEIAPERDVIAVVAPERREDAAALADVPEELCENFALRGLVGGRECVEAMAELLRAQTLGAECRVVRVIEPPCTHFFLVRHTLPPVLLEFFGEPPRRTVMIRKKPAGRIGRSALFAF